MIREITAQSILRKHKKIDSWFMSRYGMNLYRGCTHNCVYCDGRAEGYYVNGEFGQDVEVKINAIDLLTREFDPARKRNPMKKGLVMVGGGVGDSYQQVETSYRLTRKALGLLQDLNYPVHILTKSVLIERDTDILENINRRSKAIISMSFSTVDKSIARFFEPGAAAPDDRLVTLKRFKDRGFLCGLFLMPVIPSISDTKEKFEEIFYAAKIAGIDFIIFAGMTLKEGRQKGYFMNALKIFNSSLIPQYLSLYRGDKWGGARWDYYECIHKLFYSIAQNYKIPIRIPVTLIGNQIDEDDRIIAILEQMDYLMKFRNIKSNYAKAAQVLSQQGSITLQTITNFTSLPGLYKSTADTILEIYHTGRSVEYEKLLNYD